MFLDASAIVAIIAGEADAVELGSKLERANERYMSPLVHYEAVLATARALDTTLERSTSLVDKLIERSGVRLLALDESISRAAIEAFARFGKGRHRAELNMGDCFAYACAKSLGVPLLCKGDDFRHTDIQLA